MKQDELNEILRKHDLWLRGEVGGERADLRRANLRGADLRGADLRGADLTRADLDFSSWPLWCGSLGAKIDSRLAKQLVYHALAVLPKEDRGAFISDPVAYANGFHRVGDCPALDWGGKG